MSLLLIARKLWQYKFVTCSIVGFVLFGAYYVVAVTPPTYEASATYILVNPPPPPTEAEIARDPSLGRVSDDNPYARFSDQTILVQVLSSRLDSEDTRLRLAQQGADPNYTAAPSAEFGFSAPILQITGTGTSAAAAIKTANLVGQFTTRELDAMQRARGVNKEYRIKTEAVVTAQDAKLRPSGKLRSLVGVFLLGGVMLFIAVSVLDAVSALRAESARHRRRADEHSATEDAVAPARTLHPDSRSDSDPHPETVAWPLEAQR
jgi:hypothetical protein